jgi:mannobiose 2-epimerase
LHGGFFHRVRLDGSLLADNKRGYGHAFALLALSELARASGDPVWPEAASRTWQTIAALLIDDEGSLRSDANRRFAPAQAEARSQNPSMHLFEALLALAQVRDAATAEQGLRGAQRFGAWVVSRLVQGEADGSARVPEWYDGHWRPLDNRNGYTDLGHQFEWVHLMIDATRLGVSPTLAAVADRVLQFGLAQGYDEIDGGCFDRVQVDGRVERRKGWWQQAECLHGLMVAADATQRPELWRRVDQTLSWVQRTLIDPTHGGWRPGGDCLDRGCDDLQPDPYHMAQMHRAAWRLAG